MFDLPCKPPFCKFLIKTILVPYHITVCNMNFIVTDCSYYNFD